MHGNSARVAGFRRGETHLVLGKKQKGQVRREVVHQAAVYTDLRPMVHGDVEVDVPSGLGVFGLQPAANPLFWGGGSFLAFDRNMRAVVPPQVRDG